SYLPHSRPRPRLPSFPTRRSSDLLLRGAPPRKQLDVVFYRPPQIEVPVRAVPLPLPRGASAAGPPLGGKPHAPAPKPIPNAPEGDRKSTRLNSSHVSISYAVFCLK